MTMAEMEPLAIHIRSYLEGSGFTQTARRVKELRMEQMQLNAASAKLSNQLGVPYNDVSRLVKQATNEAKRFKFEWLGVLFFSQQVARASTNVLKHLISDYRELTKGGTDPLNQSLTRLNASFKFLSFAIVDAASPLIMSFADGLSWLAVTIAKMDPKVLAALFVTLASIAAIATLGYVAAQVKLFANSLAILFTQTTAENVAGVNKMSNALKGLAWAGAILSTITFIIEIFRVFKLDGQDSPGLGALVLSGASAGAFIGFLIGGPIGALIGAGAGVVAGALVFSIDLALELKEKGKFKQAMMQSVHEIVDETFGSVGGFADTTTGFFLFNIPLTIRLLTKMDEVRDNANAAAEGLAPTLENLEAASLLSNTSAEDIKNLGMTIQSSLVPALNDPKKGLNVPLNESVNLTGQLNANITEQNTRLKDILANHISDTEARNANADAINAQADANFRYADSIIEIAESKARASKIASASAGV